MDTPSQRPRGFVNAPGLPDRHPRQPGRAPYALLISCLGLLRGGQWADNECRICRCRLADYDTRNAILCVNLCRTTHLRPLQHFYLSYLFSSILFFVTPGESRRSSVAFSIDRNVKKEFSPLLMIIINRIENRVSRYVRDAHSHDLLKVLRIGVLPILNGLSLPRYCEENVNSPGDSLSSDALRLGGFVDKRVRYLVMNPPPDPIP
ncbi:hypothetical protein F4778DRAFT_50537 [Xylariomycetidae sp. FL2044]|nr:hypothetical protein F4778DRAFT_50537 [Xylariomycetidae sp. FL2044]